MTVYNEELDALISRLIAPQWHCESLRNESADAIYVLRARVAELERSKNAAYLERNQVVAALAKCFPSCTARTAIEGWSEDWHGCVYIDLPTGQVSWHYHDSHAHLFAGLPAHKSKWDGHTTPEKYQRLAALPNVESQLQQVKADAERYRWLRGPDSHTEYHAAWTLGWRITDGNNPYHGKRCDTCIDAARRIDDSRPAD